MGIVFLERGKMYAPNDLLDNMLYNMLELFHVKNLPLYTRQLGKTDRKDC